MRLLRCTISAHCIAALTAGCGAPDDAALQRAVQPFDALPKPLPVEQSVLLDDSAAAAPVRPTPDDPTDCALPARSPDVAARPCRQTVLRRDGSTWFQFWSYDAEGHILRWGDASEDSFERHWQGAWLVETTRSPGAVDQTVTRYAGGVPVVGYSGSHREWKTVYDAVGRVAATYWFDRPSGTFEQRGRSYYDAAGRLFYERTGDADEIRSYYHNGRLKERVVNDWGLDRRTTESYDACGHQTGASFDATAGRSSHWWQYDARGLLVSDGYDDDTGQPGGPTRGGSTYRYDVDGDGRVVASEVESQSTHRQNGQLTTWTSFAQTRYRYDDRGRLVDARGPDGRGTSWRYDADGRLVEEYDGQQWTTYSYDGCTE